MEIKVRQLRVIGCSLVGSLALLVSCGDAPQSTTIETSSTTIETSSTTIETSSTTIQVDTSVLFNVGDIGPGGGTIVYVDEAGFSNASGDLYTIGAVCLIPVCHYLESAPSDVKGEFTWPEAIKVAEDYATANADDWVLPSKDALNQVCKYAFRDTVNAMCNNDSDGPLFNSVGDFLNGQYWSSSEAGKEGAFIQDFRTGYSYGSYRVQKYFVRPVRAF
jgi:hypothetical protein